jgi:hypothetical protein
MRYSKYCILTGQKMHVDDHASTLEAILPFPQEDLINQPRRKKRLSSLWFVSSFPVLCVLNKRLCY